MQWEVLTAKNGMPTLQLNNVLLYSRYRPQEDALRWVEAEFDESKTSYLLIGLGLGYHAEHLAKIADGKQVFVYCFEQQEFDLYRQYNLISSGFEIVHDLQGTLMDENVQILIPNQLLKAIGIEHPIFSYLEVIKINQVTYKKFSGLMEHNFKENLYFWTKKTSYPDYTKKVACLVASGPSLNTTIHWLKKVQEQVEIFAVGSSLKLLLANEIIPAAVIISDAKDSIIQQLDGANYNGSLYFLSTANEKAVKKHSGPAYLLLQQGYPPAQLVAQKYELPLLETGGSVSTITLSLLDYLGFEKIILFGQDLGFHGNETHAKHSTSGRIIQHDLNLRIALANDSSKIYTTPNLQTYARWIEHKVGRMSAQIYTTSVRGIYIPKVPYIDENQLLQYIQS